METQNLVGDLEYRNGLFAETFTHPDDEVWLDLVKKISCDVQAIWNHDDLDQIYNVCYGKIWGSNTYTKTIAYERSRPNWL